MQAFNMAHYAGMADAIDPLPTSNGDPLLDAIADPETGIVGGDAAACLQLFGQDEADQAGDNLPAAATMEGMEQEL